MNNNNTSKWIYFILTAFFLRLDVRPKNFKEDTGMFHKGKFYCYVDAPLHYSAHCPTSTEHFQSQGSTKSHSSLV